MHTRTLGSTGPAVSAQSGGDLQIEYWLLSCARERLELLRVLGVEEFPTGATAAPVR